MNTMPSPTRPSTTRPTSANSVAGTHMATTTQRRRRLPAGAPGEHRRRGSPRADEEHRHGERHDVRRAHQVEPIDVCSDRARHRSAMARRCAPRRRTTRTSRRARRARRAPGSAALPRTSSAPAARRRRPRGRWGGSRAVVPDPGRRSRADPSVPGRLDGTQVRGRRRVAPSARSRRRTGRAGGRLAPCGCVGRQRAPRRHVARRRRGRALAARPSSPVRRWPAACDDGRRLHPRHPARQPGVRGPRPARGTRRGAAPPRVAARRPADVEPRRSHRRPPDGPAGRRPASDRRPGACVRAATSTVRRRRPGPTAAGPPPARPRRARAAAAAWVSRRRRATARRAVDLGTVRSQSSVGRRAGRPSVSSWCAPRRRCPERGPPCAAPPRPPATAHRPDRRRDRRPGRRHRRGRHRGSRHRRCWCGRAPTPSSGRAGAPDPGRDGSRAPGSGSAGRRSPGGRGWP